MKNFFKKAAAWIVGPKSDAALFVILLVLVNLVGYRAFFRVDLTSQHSYSLSAASREVIKTIDEPLAIKVFFSANLPAPYNGTERYLRDLLVEYKAASRRDFTYEFFDMEKPESQELARGYGLNQIQVQEVKDNEVGFKNAYMGLAIVYSDRIEAVDGLTASDGLEYRLTTTISKMISTTNALAGLSGKVELKFFVTPALGNFGINGFADLGKKVEAAYQSVNKKSLDRVSYERVEVSSASDIDNVVAKYGLQKITWSDRKDGATTGAGVLGLVLSYRDRSRVIPLELARGIFGGYGVAGLDQLADNLKTNLQSLMSKSLSVGYVTGHGELDLQDAQQGAARLSSIVSDMYELKDVNLSSGPIPADVTSLIVNGPKTAFSDVELYRLDQFLLRGGSVALFLDPFNEVQSQQSYFGGQPQYLPIDTGLNKLLAKYGLSAPQSYVLDKTCYEANQQGLGKMPLYYVPVIGKEGMNPASAISKNLAYVIFLKSGPIDVTLDKSNKDRAVTPLVTSSATSWTMSDQINLMPMGMSVPTDPAKLAKRNLAVLVEGKFDSAFDSAPAGYSDATSAGDANATDGASLTAASHLSKSLQAGKLIVVGTSAITGSAVIDENGQQPVALFVRNAIDYLNGNGDLNVMRTKGLSLNTLNVTGAAARATARSLNMYGLPLLAAVAGLLVWRARVARRRRIRDRYLPPAAQAKASEE